MPLKSILTTLIVILVLTACSGSDKAELSKLTSEISPNVYHNPFIGMTVSKPADWYAKNEVEQQRTREMGKDIAFGDNKDMRRAEEANAKRTFNLFSFSKFGPGAPVDWNPSLSGLIEDISHVPGITSGRDYFFHLKKALLSTGLNYEFEQEYSQRTIGGRDFDQFDLFLSYNGQRIGQSYYAIRNGTYIVLFIETFGQSEHKYETEAVLDTITFDGNE